MIFVQVEVLFLQIFGLKPDITGIAAGGSSLQYSTPYTAGNLLGHKNEHQLRGVTAGCTDTPRDGHSCAAFGCVVSCPVQSVALRAMGAVSFWILWEPWAWCQAERRTSQITQIIRSLRTPVQTAMFVSLSVLVLCIHGFVYDLT